MTGVELRTGSDTAPTSGSKALISSGAVYTALTGKVTANTAITAVTSGYNFPTWDTKGLVTGASATAYRQTFSLNGTSGIEYLKLSGTSMPSAIYAPTSAGSAGQVLAWPSSGSTPIWTTAGAVPTITLNGTATAVPSFYAPTSAGTSGYILQSNGSGAPTWLNGATKFVDLTSVQRIAASKIISDNVLYFDDTAHARGDTFSANTWHNGAIKFRGSDGMSVSRIQPMFAADGNNFLYISAFDSTGTANGINIYSNGIVTLATAPPSTDNTRSVPTTAWVKSALPAITLNGTVTKTPTFYAPTAVGTSGQFLKSAGSGAPSWASLAVSDITDISTSYVDLTSAQTITGQKTFAQGPIVSSGSLIQTYSPIRISATPAVLYMQNTSFTQGTNPSSELSDYTSLFQDSAGTITAYLRHSNATDGTGYFLMSTVNNAGTLSANLQLSAHSTSTELACNCTIANFSGVIACPTVSASSNDSAVPNTSWVCTKLSNICTNIHAKFSTGYISAGSVSYTRIGLKGGICTLSFTFTGSSSTTALFANLSEIYANLGVTFAIPTSVQYTGFWFYQDGDSHADRYGYGTVCVIDTSGNLALARVYTTGGAIGTWEISNIGTGRQLFVQFPVNEA